MKLYYVLGTSHSTGPDSSNTRLRVFKSQVVGTPLARIYKEGSTPPAYSSMTDQSPVWNYAKTGITDYGNYIFEFKDDNHPSGVILAKFVVTAVGPTVCDQLGTGDVNLNTTGIKITSLGNASGAASISIDGGVTFKPTDSAAGVTYNNSEIAALGLTNKINQIVIRKSGCSDATMGYNFILDDTPPLIVTPVVTPVSTSGGNDGVISLTIAGGSGSFTFSWADGPTTQNRSALVAGTYTVTVTDVITSIVEIIPVQVTEPVLIPDQVGTFLTVPAMNSLTYVVEQAIDECTNPQALDNVLFADQYFEGVDQNEQNYFQKVNKCDTLVTQFNSDYPFFQVLLKDYCSGEVIKEFPYILQEQNIGKTDDFALQLQNHTIFGQTRVYFGVGVPPIPLTVGDSFTILNNVNFNGTYSIVSILTDPIRGYQYIVINKVFTGIPTQTATGRFLTTTANFNVFESQHDFTDVADGKYYITIRAYDNDLISPDITAISEPIELKVYHPETNLLRYRCIDNAFDMTWTTGYLALLRVPSHFGNHRQPGGDRSTTRDSDFTLVKVNARKSRIVLFNTWGMPPYMHEKLSVAFDCDEITINGLSCQTSDAYDAADDDDYKMLTKGTIKVEVKWFSGYNSDDIGSVQDGGFLKTESGFLKR